jgi:hypothetical protein
MAFPGGRLRTSAVRCPTAAPNQLNGVGYDLTESPAGSLRLTEVAVPQNDTGPVSSPQTRAVKMSSCTHPYSRVI